MKGNQTGTPLRMALRRCTNCVYGIAVENKHKLDDGRVPNAIFLSFLGCRLHHIRRGVTVKFPKNKNRLPLIRQQKISIKSNY